MSETRTTDRQALPASEADHRLRGLAATGLLATLAAMASTAAVAALARASGVDLAIPDGGERIPLSGIAFVTGVFSLVGVAIAVALLRWRPRPAEWFLRTTVSLTALSLAPPLLVGADTATALTLVGLHLVAAAVMVPTLTKAIARRAR